MAKNIVIMKRCLCPDKMCFRFGAAFLRTGQIFPAGVVAAISCVMVVKYGIRLL